MTSHRKIDTMFKSQPVTEGAGVRLRRAFGHAESPRFDPFLLLDDFRSDDPADYTAGFPWHPHRGIETITYVLEGDVEHGDSLGNQGVISSGDVQWMTAGSGIIHQEMPRGDDRGSMHGFQLWANLPAGSKMMHPRYRDISAGQIPLVEQPDRVKIRVVAGVVDGVRGPVQDIVIDPEYLDCTVPKDVRYVHATEPDRTAFIYVTGGRGEVDETPVTNRTLVLFSSGDAFSVRATSDSVRFLLFTGRPLKEPVAWHGPIVMNTQAELETAFREYRENTFIKHS